MFAVGAVVDLPASALSMLMPVLSGAITPSSHADEPAVGPWLHEYDVKKIVPAPVSDSPVLKKIPVVDEPVEADPGGMTLLPATGQFCGFGERIWRGSLRATAGG